MWKIWVLYIPEYVRNKWNLVYYSNLQYIVCTNILLSPGRAWNFHQSKLSSQTSWTSNCLTQVWNVIWFVKKKSKKNRRATKHSNEPRPNPPSGVSKCEEFSELWYGGVETKKYAGPNEVRPWRAPKIPVERKLNTVFIFAPRGDHSRAFSAKRLPSTTPTWPHTTILACLLSNSEVRGGLDHIDLVPTVWVRRRLFSKNNPQFSRSAALSVCVEVRGAWMSGMNPYV